MGKKKKKRKTELDIILSVPIGTRHFLRSGAGAHQDKRKQESKDKCRTRVDDETEIG